MKARNWIAARYDDHLHPHHHFICDKCGVMEDICWFDLPDGMAGAALDGRRLDNYELYSSTQVRRPVQNV